MQVYSAKDNNLPFVKNDVIIIPQSASWSMGVNTKLSMNIFPFK